MEEQLLQMPLTKDIDEKRTLELGNMGIVGASNEKVPSGSPVLFELRKKIKSETYRQLMFC